MPDNKTSSDDEVEDKAGEGDSGRSTAVDVNAEASANLVEPKQTADVSRWKRLGQAYWRRKLWTLPLTAVFLVAASLAVPAVRYPAFATFMEKDVSVLVIDAGTKRPVGSAVVVLDGAKTMTDNQGRAKVKARVGERTLNVSKKYYREAAYDTFVPIGKPAGPVEVAIQATGRQVALAVSNKLNGKPVENILIKAAGTEVKTDKDGKATLVLPAEKAELAAVLSGAGFNELNTKLAVTEASDARNNFQITPSGTLYFLSKQSGKIDVVRTNLDGSGRKTIVAGTGREEDRNTVLLSSKDWKYLALLSRRDSSTPKLYLIETAAERLTVIDEGAATFQPVGWSDNSFVFNAVRQGDNLSQSGQQSLKVYDATAAKLAVVDQTTAEGDESNYRAQSFSGFNIIDGNIIYATNWVGYTYGPEAAGKNHVIRSVGIKGQNKKDLKGFSVEKHSQIETKLYAPKKIYYAVNSYDVRRNIFFGYEQGIVNPVLLDDAAFYDRVYPTYVASPSDKRVIWSEQRDGKDTFFTGNRIAEDQRQVAVIADHQAYGWYGDDYLLVSKDGSQLFILPVDGGKLTKVTDYHRPDSNFRGYGGGYGGL